MLTGVMAVPDAFGRLRVLLVDRLRDGRSGTSWATLSAAAPGSGDASAPFEFGAPDADGVRGEFRATPPAHRKKYWLGVAEELRGQEVRVEVTVRPFSFVRADGVTWVSGMALDLAMVEPLVPGSRI